MNAGKWLILGVFLTALLAACASWTFRYAQTNDTQRLLGTAAVQLINQAPRVTAAVVDDSGRRTRDVSKAPGMPNIRHTLLHDAAFDWEHPLADFDAERAARPTTWELQFNDGDRGEVVQLNWDCTCARLEKADRAIRLTTPAAANLRSFFAKHFPNEAKLLDGPATDGR